MMSLKRYALLKIMLGLCALSTSVFSQNNTILDEFSISENQGKVYLFWIITSGSTCEGIKIFRSEDDLNFQQIDEIGGVCGSSSAPQPYSFIDEHPVKNRMNYYRLELGSTGFSETRSIEIIDFHDYGYQVRPNPLTDNGRIVFENDLRRPCILTIYHANGQQADLQSTEANVFIINTLILSNGLYFFTISTEDYPKKIKGKFLVMH